MKKAFLFTLLLLFPLSSFATTHALIISVCPPWKDGGDPETTKLMGASCNNTVQLLQNKLSHHLQIKKENQIVLLNKDGSYANFVKTAQSLKSKIKADDRVLVYVNLHGGNLAGSYRGYMIQDEGMAFWTEKEPNISTAVNEKKYMLVKQFRDIVLQNILAKKVIFIFDSCESGAAYHDFRYNPYSDERRIAVVFSSQKDQFSNYTSDYKFPLFTDKLLHALPLAAYETFSYAVNLAASATHRSQRARCAIPQVRKIFSDAEIDLNSVCLQQPYFFDPTGLLDDWKIIPDES